MIINLQTTNPEAPHEFQAYRSVILIVDTAYELNDIVRLSMVLSIKVSPTMIINLQQITNLKAPHEFRSCRSVILTVDTASGKLTGWVLVILA